MDGGMKGELFEHYGEDLGKAIDKIKDYDNEIGRSLDHYVRGVSCLLNLADESEKTLGNSKIKSTPDFIKELNLYRYSILKIIFGLSVDDFLRYVKDDIKKYGRGLDRNFWDNFFSKYFN